MNQAKLEWITFDLDGWQEITNAEMDSESMRVFTKDGVILGKAIKHLPSDFPHGIDNIREGMRNQTAQSGGVLISSDIHDFGKVEGVISIFKSKTPNPTGFQFSASIIICYRDFFYAINLQAEERGITGIRESTIWAALKIPPENKEWFNHPYGTEFNDNEVKYNLSDDSVYDEKFPNHPLTRIRAMINSIANTISFSEELKYSEPYPLK